MPPKLFRLVATCPEETKETLMGELKSISALELQPHYKAISFTVDEEGFYRSHLHLRTASNITWIVKDFSAKTKPMLNSQARRIRWEDYINENKTFIVNAIQTERGNGEFSGNDLSKAIRVAIQERFGSLNLAIPQVDLKEPEVKLLVFNRGGKCHVGFSTSGKALHKRGFRPESNHPAPLKETLAASLLLMARYDGTEALFDPMCGSGTIITEAAMIGMQKSPLIHRKKGEFGFESLKIFNRDLWRKIQDQTRLEKKSESNVQIFASDVDSRYVNQAKENALRARVEKHINFSVGDFLKTKKPAPNGLLICNMPYGERLEGLESEGLEKFYAAVGTHLKHEFSGWRAGLLVGEGSPYKHLGLKPSRTWRLLNGSIPCRFVMFDLFSGKRAQHLENKNLASH